MSREHFQREAIEAGFTEEQADFMWHYFVRLSEQGVEGLESRWAAKETRDDCKNL